MEVGQMSSGICGLNMWTVYVDCNSSQGQQSSVPRSVETVPAPYLLQIRKEKNRKVLHLSGVVCCQTVAIVTVGYFVEVEVGNAAGGGGCGGGYIYEMEGTWW